LAITKKKEKKQKKKRKTIKIMQHQINPLQSKVFEMKFSLREIRRIFLTKIRNFKLFKMPEL